MVLVGVMEIEGVTDADSEIVGVTDVESETVGVTDAESDMLGVTDVESDMLGVIDAAALVGAGDGDAVSEMADVRDGEVVLLSDCDDVGVFVHVSDRLSVMLIVRVSEMLLVKDADFVEDLVIDGLLVVDLDFFADLETDALFVNGFVAERLSEGVGDSDGSTCSALPSSCATDSTETGEQTDASTNMLLAAKVALRWRPLAEGATMRKREYAGASLAWLLCKCCSSALASSCSDNVT